MSMPCASISPMRRGPTWSMPGPRCVSTFSPSRETASGITQWACTSIVLTRRPPTTTSRRRPTTLSARRRSTPIPRPFARAAGRVLAPTRRPEAARRSHSVKAMGDVLPLNALAAGIGRSPQGASPRQTTRPRPCYLCCSSQCAIPIERLQRRGRRESGRPRRSGRLSCGKAGRGRCGSGRRAAACRSPRRGSARTRSARWRPRRPGARRSTRSRRAGAEPSPPHPAHAARGRPRGRASRRPAPRRASGQEVRLAAPSDPNGIVRRASASGQPRGTRRGGVAPRPGRPESAYTCPRWPARNESQTPMPASRQRASPRSRCSMASASSPRKWQAPPSAAREATSGSGRRWRERSPRPRVPPGGRVRSPRAAPGRT
jgi:hypothetical protein